MPRRSRREVEEMRGEAEARRGEGWARVRRGRGEASRGEVKVEAETRPCKGRGS